MLRLDVIVPEGTFFSSSSQDHCARPKCLQYHVYLDGSHHTVHAQQYSVELGVSASPLAGLNMC